MIHTIQKFPACRKKGKTMAKITVYRNRPFLTLFSWLGGGCVFAGISSLFGKEFLVAYGCVLMGIAILHYCDARSDGRKVRYNARFVAVLVLIWPALQLLEWAVQGKLAQLFDPLDLVIPVLLAAVLYLPQVKNKPLVMAAACLVLQIMELITGIGSLKIAMGHSTGAAVFMGFTILLPGIFALIFLLRGRKMLPAERQRYIF